MLKFKPPSGSLISSHRATELGQTACRLLGRRCSLQPHHCSQRPVLPNRSARSLSESQVDTNKGCSSSRADAEKIQQQRQSSDATNATQSIRCSVAKRFMSSARRSSCPGASRAMEHGDLPSLGLRIQQGLYGSFAQCCTNSCACCAFCSIWPPEVSKKSVDGLGMPNS